MKNVICIDLTKFNEEKLVEISKLVGLEYNTLLEKKKNGFIKLFIDKTTGKTIAFTTKSNEEKIVYTNDLNGILESITPLVLPKKTKKMTIDSILDKISKYGIESLSEDEKNFLNKQV